MHRPCLRTLLSCSVAVAALAVGQAAQADTITLNASARGGMLSGLGIQSGGAGTANGNYNTGAQFVANWEGRSAFLFDLSSINGTVTAATFSAAKGSSGGNNAGSSTNLNLYALDTTVVSTLFPGSYSATSWTDFGSGTLLGTASIIISTVSNPVTVELNAAGVQAINDVIGTASLFGFGAALSAPSFRGIFGGTGEGFATTLALTYTPTTVTPAPEPMSLALFGLGLAGFAAIRRRAA